MNFKNNSDLIPVIIQDAQNLQVLMLGYMNKEAYEKTLEINKVTFFSRSKNRLWTKGEQSGNFLFPKEILWDCDTDTILIKARRTGPVCHTGQINCFNSKLEQGFIFELENIIENRIHENSEKSYTSKLVNSGIDKVTQKVGEEAIELVIESMKNNDFDFKNEAADLLFHFLILCRAKNISLKEIIEILDDRNNKST